MKHLLATPFILAGLYHLIAVLIPNFGEPAPLWRHLLFIGVNGLMTVLLYRRPKTFFVFACVLIMQQLWSHGIYALKVYQQQNRIDWYSIIVIFGFPIYLWLYWYQFRKRSITQLRK